jgi:predicted transcriptional regulator of viral defense system
MKDLVEAPPGENPALKAFAPSMDSPAMEQIRRDLLASALAQIDISALAPNLNTLLIESIAKITAKITAQITADLAPLVDALTAAAFAQIDLSALGPAIDAATRQVIDRAAVIEAVENSGYRAALYKVADEHHGYVTTALANAAGVPSVEVRKLASRGGMTNIARGLYRVDGIDGGDHAAYAEAVLRVGDDAHLVGDSVLAFHELALVNPRHITVGTPRRVRRDLPAHVRLVHSRTDPTDLTEYDGVRSMTVERAIRDSIGSIMPERLASAARRAAEEGLLRRAAADALLDEIGSAA